VTYQYVPARTNHILHLLLTMFSFGLWAPVWVTVWLFNHNRTIARLVPAAYAPAYATGQSAGHQTAAQPSAQLQAAPVWAGHSYDPRFDVDGQLWCITHSAWETSPAAPSQVP
jgi:hypothetical protein